MLFLKLEKTKKRRKSIITTTFLPKITLKNILFLNNKKCAKICFFSTRTVFYIVQRRQTAQEPVLQAVEVACRDRITHAEKVLHFPVNEGLEDGQHNGLVALHARPFCKRHQGTEEATEESTRV